MQAQTQAQMQDAGRVERQVSGWSLGVSSHSHPPIHTRQTNHARLRRNVHDNATAQLNNNEQLRKPKEFWAYIANKSIRFAGKSFFV